VASEIHVQSHLLVRDVSSGHAGVLVLAVETRILPAHAATADVGLKPAPPVGSAGGRVEPARRSIRPAICSCRPPVIRAVALETLDRLVAYLDERGIGMRRSRIGEVLLAEGLRWRQEETWFGARVDPDFTRKRGRSSGSTPHHRRAA
jgi:hypothetical protein